VLDTHTHIYVVFHAFPITSLLRKTKTFRFAGFYDNALCIVVYVVLRNVGPCRAYCALAFYRRVETTPGKPYKNNNQKQTVSDTSRSILTREHRRDSVSSSSSGRGRRRRIEFLRDSSTETTRDGRNFSHLKQRVFFFHCFAFPRRTPSF